jgi:hypothetical protein
VIKWINVKTYKPHPYEKDCFFIAFCLVPLPWMVSAQSIDDDLYYIPSKDKKEKKQEKKVTSSAPTEEIVVKSNAPTTVYTSPGNTTVVVQDRKGNTRDVDEYNRRYDSRENDFVMEDDTLYIKEKAVPDPDGEWVNGFDGSEDDYEYAMRIVRFRNPRYAVSISSPYYWDIVYGLNSWDWNVYTDGMYAYAFPTFSNRLWWDWRYNSYGWGGYPYYGGVDTHLITVTVAGPMAGAVSTVAGVGDGDIITIIIILAVAGIPVAVDTGEATIGATIMFIRAGVLWK